MYLKFAVDEGNSENLKKSGKEIRRITVLID